MGIGDEIMALGLCERASEQTGNPVSIVGMYGNPRDFDIWHGNPHWNYNAQQKITDGGGSRNYIEGWKGRQAIYNLNYRARAGRIHLDKSHRNFANEYCNKPFAVISPRIKKGASPNKDWGENKWAEVIKEFSIKVYQLSPDKNEKPIDGAELIVTPSVKHACAIISRAALVLCNEGGTHHMAASMRVPAVVVFGSFVPPTVTGYEFHHNLAVQTDHGYCGKWDVCKTCQESLKIITPEMVKEKANLILESYDEF